MAPNLNQKLILALIVAVSLAALTLSALAPGFSLDVTVVYGAF